MNYPNTDAEDARVAHETQQIADALNGQGR
jgi:hypothetical protein